MKYIKKNVTTAALQVMNTLALWLNRVERLLIIDYSKYGYKNSQVTELLEAQIRNDRQAKFT